MSDWGTMPRDSLRPISLADNGLRWHVLAYDRERSPFSDFVLNRLSKTQQLDVPVAKHELLATDEQWARIVDMVPPKAVEADYSMVGGVLRLKARAALAGYVLRMWSVDSTPDHSLDPANHLLWLANAPTLYGVESATLAPGLGCIQKTADKATKSASGKPKTSSR